VNSRTNKTTTRDPARKMDALLGKLQNAREKSINWSNWTPEEQLSLLKLYSVFVKRESDLYQLIYSSHGCDTFEGIFRDYDEVDLRDKLVGINITTKIMKQKIRNARRKLKKRAFQDSQH
jgi:hypothetical protein